MFECRLRNAIDEVGCVPWDYPIPPTITMEGINQLCNSSFAHDETVENSTLSRFEAFMNSGESMTNCECLADCEEVVYEAQVFLHNILIVTLYAAWFIFIRWIGHQ